MHLADTFIQSTYIVLKEDIFIRSSILWESNPWYTPYFAVWATGI